MTDNRKPNVIVFFTDQQRWDTTGIHGNPLDLTPNFDRMAREGTHIYHSFTCQPVCAPARACLQTGRYATENGVFRNGISLDRVETTLAAYFKEAGYQTGYIGKWHLADQEPVPKEQRGGYEEWLGSNALELCSDAYDTVLYNDDNETTKLPGYRVDAMTDEVIRFIDRHQEDPFFLFVSYLEPHHQNHLDSYPAPDGYEERYTGKWSPADLSALGGTSAQHLGGYYGMVKKLDEALGRVRDGLKSLQMDEHTIILYTSDHGCHFKTRNSEYKRSCHDSSLRVPTALVGPGFNGGGQVKELVSLIDLPPTLLGAAGISVPNHMQGRSVLSLLAHTDTDWPQEIFYQISESQVGRGIRTSRWKYSVSAPKKDSWNDSYSDTYEEEFLYDLHADPHELNNIIQLDAFHHVKSELKQKLLDRIAAIEGKNPEIISAAEEPSGQRAMEIRAGSDQG
ncbi:sulfatase-like hydrolase/transferase [Gracilibacillus alcaliphilus]|uniref:sulfatase-like hydrolase/transferase n=1 Tax=Gracilibacillus alcaliphilus TaxID=1401441 RepID=UPI00195D58B1|nr:sulfatase-like hydrolase/transferase [Gracilibacillus alcaliphilus]MBM7676766.1 arylsulfatase A-like enzyme [Gracilibacillus alcaliphilus]